MTVECVDDSDSENEPAQRSPNEPQKDEKQTGSTSNETTLGPVFRLAVGLITVLNGFKVELFVAVPKLIVTTGK